MHVSRDDAIANREIMAPTTRSASRGQSKPWRAKCFRATCNRPVPDGRGIYCAAHRCTNMGKLGCTNLAAYNRAKKRWHLHCREHLVQLVQYI